MNKILPLILFFVYSLLNLCASEEANMEDRYSSFNAGFDIATGDIDATGFSFGAINQLAKDGQDGIALLGNFEYLSIDEYLGVNVSAADVEAFAYTLGIGYIFKADDMHIIPYYGFSKLELGVQGFSAGEADSTAFGIMFRKQISPSAILTFDIINTSLDDVTVVGSNVPVYSSAETSFSFDIENKINENTAIIYGADFADGINSYSIGMSINF
tara:strand:- start:172 stop:813 length:642 start_codon:yes stop_codon:yes gene_type:complete